MSNTSALETKIEFEEQKQFIIELQNRLAGAELKIVEGEKLRKKLHNTILVMFLYTSILCKLNFDENLNCSSSISVEIIHPNYYVIQELKGNIRVFCRVRPLLSDDGVETENKVVSFPTAMETLGRGIDLTLNGE